MDTFNAQLEKNYISSVPAIKAWFNQKPEDRNEETWNQFLSDTEQALSAHADATPEEQLDLIKQCASVLSQTKKKK